MNFNALVQNIADIHQRAYTGASKAINTTLTLRNWLIGAHIHEYELQGQDRAAYGDRLIGNLSKSLLELGVPACDRVRLYSYVTFYRAYPQLSEAISVEMLPAGFSQGQFPIVRTLSEQSSAGAQEGEYPLSGKLLLSHLSFSHLDLLSAIEDPLKRAFYELECIKGNWSVRELKRQIGSLYFERSGLSRDPAKLSALANATTLQADPAHKVGAFSHEQLGQLNTYVTYYLEQ